MRILIICSGNTCRSPMAEIILREELAMAGVKDVEVRSAGIMSAGGEAMSPYGSKALVSGGYGDGEAFRSTAMDQVSLTGYDRIYCLTQSQVTVMIHRFPEIAGKTRALALTETGLPKDISDPFGGPLETYLNTFEEIRDAVMKLVVELKKDNG